MTIDTPAEPPQEGTVLPGPRETWSLANGVPRQVFGSLLLNVHPFSECSGASLRYGEATSGCPLHRPSNHGMRGWPLSYRSDRKIFERLCPHGVGHPDPDSVSRHWVTRRQNESIHRCDGCCVGLGFRED